MPQDGHLKGHLIQLEKKYGGLGVIELRKLWQLEEEYYQLKKLVADLSLDKQMLTRRAEIKALRPVQLRGLAQSLIEDYSMS
ncbi:hypothetical protein GCM10023188_34770 [Pontibacter saemangeumensis]|uniref:Uncharacterized protein n=1 Tax=Pontibacter saemangeumensis TaxID=1084525 RepID=A0ABP8LZU4_9BACT